MLLNFTPKHADKAYISNRLWLPKSRVRAGPVKKALEFTVYSETQKAQVLLRMWEESSKHIICPREFLPASEYEKYDFPFVDLRPSFQHVDFEDHVVPRDEEQQRAWEALAKNDNGILNLGCGKGKTILAFKKIAQRGVPALVVVPDSGIMEQWVQGVQGDPATGRKKAISFEGELGMIRGPVFNWARPLTIALITTLWKRIEDGTAPEELFRYFGQVIWDEVHIVGAPKLSLTAGPFYGDRIGLTATHEREDGLDPIYKFHIGEPFYSDLTQQLIPNIYFQQTPAVIDYAKAVVNGASNISLLRGLIGKSKIGNVFRYQHIKTALEQGRKILCLSHSKNQLKLFHKLFPGSGLIVQETKNRMDVLRNSRVCFAIARLGSQGVDDQALDTLMALTPFKAKNGVQQSMGRIQREASGKHDPVFVVFEDWLAPPIKNICRAMRTELRKSKYAFTVVKPNNVLLELPAEVDEIYERTAAELWGSAPADDGLDDEQ
jgi:superfamily II DNA or RNA helicase